MPGLELPIRWPRVAARLDCRAGSAKLFEETPADIESSFASEPRRAASAGAGTKNVPPAGPMPGASKYCLSFSCQCLSTFIPTSRGTDREIPTASHGCSTGDRAPRISGHVAPCGMLTIGNGI